MFVSRVAITIFVYRRYSTTLHLSKEVGATGSRHLRELYEVLTEMQSERKIYPISITLPDKEYTAFLSGTTFPGLILRNYDDCYWADDFVDLEEDDDFIERRLSSHGRQFLDAVEIVRSQLKYA